MTFIRNKVLLFLFSLSLNSCSSGSVGYWEFKLIEKSIDTLTNIFKNNKSKTIKKIEIPSLPNPPDTTIQIAVSSLNGSNVSKSEIIALTERLRSELLLTKFFKVLERDVMDDEVTKLRTSRQKSIDESKEKKEKERLEKEKARLELIKSEKDKNII